MITATNLTMAYGSKTLFKNVSFQLNPKQHYGLIGANGAGKSTLVKILTGDIIPEAGDVSIPPQVTIGTLKQNHYLFENERILDVVLMGNISLWNALQSKEELLAHDHFTEASCKKLENFEKTIAEHNGYSAPSEAAKLLEGLGIYANVHEKPLSVLSGGYKLRVLLAQVLFSNPAILLLDEPTNHLDLHSIRWLEDYLKDFPGTILISSHDCDFLNAICDYTLDLDHQTIKLYKGNYNDFLELKASDLELRMSQMEKQEKKRDDLQNFIDRFKAKATKARQAQSKAKLVEKLEESMAQSELSPSIRMYPKLQFDQCRPSGAIALTIKDIHKSYGPKQVLHGVSLEVERGDRLAILGANGIGKSTLLEIITQYTEATAGTFHWGHAVQVAYFPQDHKREVHGDISLLDWLRQFDREIPEQRIRDYLGRVLFSGEDVKKSVSVLSGGETARLILAKMMLMKHNVLIFDEPTNHLDMEATEALLEALENYPGTVIFVSHNRHFVAKIATRIAEISEEGIKDFKLTFAEYLAKRDTDLLTAKGSQRRQDSDSNFAKETQKQKFENQKNQRNLKAQLEKRIHILEVKCEDLEKKIKQTEETLSTEGFYQKTSPAKVQELLNTKALLESQLAEAFKEWEDKNNELIAIP